MITNLSLPFLAFLQATGILVYVSLVSIFMNNANKIFGPAGGFFGPIAFLLLFIVSAMITGSPAGMTVRRKCHFVLRLLYLP